MVEDQKALVWAKVMIRHRRALKYSALAICMCSVTDGKGQVLVEPVALSGETAPGTSGDAAFSSGAGRIFGPPMINNRGEIAFWARTLTVAAPQSTGYGIWMGQPGELLLVARTGDAAPGLPPGSAYLNIRDYGRIEMRLNESGEVAFFTELTGPAVQGAIRQYGIWAGRPGNLGLVVRHGDPAVEAEGNLAFRLGSTTVLSPPFLVFNDSGVVATELWHMDSDGTFLDLRGVWAGSDNPLALAALRNEQAPGTPAGVHFDHFSVISLSMNSAGRVAFSSRIRGPEIDRCDGNDSGIWMGAPGHLELVARGGQQAAGVPSGIEHTRFPPYDRIAINDTGEIAFRTELQGGPAFDRGIWAGRPDDLSLVVRSGSSAPGFPGGSFVYFEPPSLTENGLVAFGALVDTGGPMGIVDTIYVGRPGHLDLVVYEGLQVPNMQQGVVFSTILPRITPVNRHGQIVFYAWLQGPGITSDNAGTLWVGNRYGSLWLIVQIGEALEIAPGDFRVYQEVEILFTLGGEDGRSRCLNDAGYLAFRVKTGPVGAGAILKAQIPIDGDCDGDGDVDLIDYGGFEECLLGPTGGLGASLCDCFDLDASGHVDLKDFAELQINFAGN